MPFPSTDAAAPRLARRLRRDAAVALAAAALTTGTLYALTADDREVPEVDPRLEDAWTAQRATLGHPVSTPYPVTGATAQDFEHGIIYRGANGEVIALTQAELGGLHPRSAAVAYAMDHVGDPYELGADGPSVWDCSSLVQRAYRFAGADLPRTSKDQSAQLPVTGTPEEGDLLSWPGHVGLYAGTVDGHPVMVTATAHRYGGTWRKGVLLVDPTTRDGGITAVAHRNPLR